MTTTNNVAPRTGSAAPPSTIEHIRTPALNATVVYRGDICEIHATIHPLVGGEPTIGMLGRLSTLLRRYKAQVVRHEVFGSLDESQELIESIRLYFRPRDWPVTWVEGSACEREGIAGMHVFAISGTPVETLTIDGQPVGRVYHDQWARHCILSGVLPRDTSSSPSEQAAQVYHQMERALSQANLVLSDVVRTWLFLDEILSWYEPFNTVRTDIFTQRNLFASGVPASTGVGARNSAGAAVVAGAWAVQPLDGPMQIREVVSPLQCAARSYGSCFSRAVELSAPDHRRLLVSGTASILPDGRSAHANDIQHQIELTMEVVRAILASRGLRWTDVTRATVYVKDPKDSWTFAQWCTENFVSLPAVIARCDICRDELLFEIEVDVITPLKSNGDWGI